MLRDGSSRRLKFLTIAHAHKVPLRRRSSMQEKKKYQLHTVFLHNDDDNSCEATFCSVSGISSDRVVT